MGILSIKYFQLSHLSMPYDTLGRILCVFSKCHFLTAAQNVKNNFCKQITDKMSLPVVKIEEINPISLLNQLRIARNEINNLR